MADFDPIEAARKVFLAGVGAIATAGDKSQEVVDDLVRKGEETVRQGQALNEELKHRTKTVVDGGPDAALKSKLEDMTDEERDEFVKKVNDLADQVRASHVKVDVDVEDAEPAEPEDSAE